MLDTMKYTNKSSTGFGAAYNGIGGLSANVFSSETSRSNDYEYDDKALSIINSKKKDLINLLNEKLKGQCTVSGLSLDSEKVSALSIVINLSFEK